MNNNDYKLDIKPGQIIDHVIVHITATPTSEIMEFSPDFSPDFKPSSNLKIAWMLFKYAINRKKWDNRLHDAFEGPGRFFKVKVKS